MKYNPTHDILQINTIQYNKMHCVIASDNICKNYQGNNNLKTRNCTANADLGSGYSVLSIKHAVDSFTAACCKVSTLSHVMSKPSIYSVFNLGWVSLRWTCIVIWTHHSPYLLWFAQMMCTKWNLWSAWSDSLPGDGKRVSAQSGHTSSLEKLGRAVCISRCRAVSRGHPLACVRYELGEW